MSLKKQIKNPSSVKIKKELLEAKLSPQGQKAIVCYQSQIQQMKNKKPEVKQKTESNKKQLLLKIINNKKQNQLPTEQGQKEFVSVFSPKSKMQGLANFQQDFNVNKATQIVGTKFNTTHMQSNHQPQKQQNKVKKSCVNSDKKVPENCQYRYEDMNSDSEEFQDTMNEGSSIAPVAKQSFAQKRQGNNSQEQKSAQKLGPYYAQENRGRGQSRESAPSRSLSRRGKEFLKELAKCGGLLHEDPTLRPHEAQKLKGQQIEQTSKEQEIETIGNGIFPFQRRARSFSPKKELSFGGSVKLFPNDQESSSTINSTLNNQSQLRVEPVKADFGSFQKQQQNNQKILQQSWNFGNFIFTSSPCENLSSQSNQNIQENQTLQPQGTKWFADQNQINLIKSLKDPSPMEYKIKLTNESNTIGIQQVSSLKFPTLSSLQFQDKGIQEQNQNLADNIQNEASVQKEWKEDINPSKDFFSKKMNMLRIPSNQVNNHDQQEQINEQEKEEQKQTVQKELKKDASLEDILKQIEDQEE